ncbi:MAG: Gfo/Idh/MocA family oxidoreductase [Nanoarchaeota archaeon]
MVLRVAILGASGIGRYHSREYKNAGCEVVAILGSSEESASKTSKMLEKEFDISVVPYYNLTKLLDCEDLNAVSISTPLKFHYEHVRKCLEAGLHILCEKPFVQNYEEALELCNFAKQKNCILTVNTQWPSIFPLIKQYFKDEKIEKFSMYMEPFGINKADLVMECLPHFNSMLLKLYRQINPKSIKVEIKNNCVKIKFNHVSGEEACAIEYLLKIKETKPTKMGFSINNHQFEREVRENYKQVLIHNRRDVVEIEDPLSVSIRTFVRAINGDKPLISKQEVLENARLQDLLMEKLK